VLTDVEPHQQLPSARWNRDRVFFSAMALLAAVTTFLGFAPTYYLKTTYRTPPLPTLVHLHGALFTSWIALLTIQTALVAGRRTDLHRRLGMAGMVLAAAMTLIAPVVAIGAVRRGTMPLGFFIVPMTTVVVFAVLVAAAFLLRLNPPQHKRLILLATVELLTAAVGRLPLVREWGALGDYGVSDVFVAALVGYDLIVRRRLEPATLWGGLFLIASQPLRMAVGGTQAWMTLARWLTA